MIAYADVKNSEEINTYIRQADVSLKEMGYTEHSFAHVTRCAELAGAWLLDLGRDDREAELARIAAYMHDIGNVINRYGHAQSGALIVFRLLEKLGMEPEDLAVVVTAVGNHDESSAHPVSAVAAAVILADKTDVRRSRVRNDDTASFDIHDRVNYAVTRADTALDAQARTLTLDLDVDSDICSVTDYFEIFLGRMVLCRRAAEFLGLKFRLVINGSILM
ncbi:MAG: HD domain-containing protein [Oscillospiraceae bacterium]|nr:HD domain-containing protein [Oscillospiraceae bacterium]